MASANGVTGRGPAPSSPPAPSNRNLLQCCGDPRGRGARGRAGWLRAGPASLRGGKAGGRAAQPPARSLAPSLRRWVSQSVRLQPASPRVAEGPEPRTPAPPPAIVHPAAAASGGRGTLVPGAPVRRGGCSVRAGWREAGRGAVPEGTVLAAAVAPQPLCLQPAAGPGRGLWRCGLGRGRLRGCSRDAAARGERGGADLGERFEVRLGVCF